MKKTITLCDGSGNPGTVACPGHVTAKVFNAAFGREWSDRGGYKQADLKFVYMLKGPAKSKAHLFSLKVCMPDKVGAKKFTITSWD